MAAVSVKRSIAQIMVALICTVGKAIFRYIFSMFIVFFYELRLRRLKAITLKFVSRGGRQVQVFLLPQKFRSHSSHWFVWLLRLNSCSSFHRIIRAKFILGTRGYTRSYILTSPEKGSM